MTPFRSIELAGTTSLDTAAIGRAMTQAAMSHPGWGTESIKLLTVEAAGDGAWLSYRWHVWWVLPAHWRDDHTSAYMGNVVSIVSPDVALQYTSHDQTLYTSEPPSAADKRPRASAPQGRALPALDGQLDEFPLIRPQLPDSDWQLDTVGQEVCLGRAVRRVRATRRSDASHPFDTRRSGFWLGSENTNASWTTNCRFS
jgi:hypothetical protein